MDTAEITVDARVGQPFDISLPENPTTGFRWTILENGQPHCALLSDKYVPSGDLVGGGGIHTWTFLAQQPGHPAVVLVDSRPGGDIKKVYRVNIA